MKPNFALNLSHEGIGLLHRGKPGWELLGEVSLDAADFGDRLAALRRLAKSRAPEGMTTKLIIPPSQILFLDIEAPGPQAATRRKQIAAALEGVTPYAVADLVFDWSGHGDVVQVAVVARETLAEAEAFADDSGFCPVSFVAVPEPGQFKGEPWFGTTSVAAAHLPQGARIERDQDPLPLQALMSSAAPQPPEPPAPDLPDPQAPVAADAEEPPVAEVVADDVPVDLATEAQPVAQAIASDVPVDLVAQEAPPVEAPAAAPIAAKELPEAEVLAEAAPVDLSPVTEAVAKPPPVAEAQAALAAPESVETVDLVEAPDDLPPADLPPESAQPQSAQPPLADLIDGPLSDFDDLPPLQIDMPEEPALSPVPPQHKATLADLLAATDAAPPSDAAPLANPAPLADPVPAAAPKGRGREARPGFPVDLAGRTAPNPGPAKPAATRPGPAPIPAPIPAWRPPFGPMPPQGPGAAERLRKAASLGAQLAVQGGAALGSRARKAMATARSLRQRADIPPKPTLDIGKTVFGGRKAAPVGGKPKYMGVMLVGSLVGFLAIAALWSSFIGTSDDPAPKGSAATAPKLAAVPAAPAPTAPASTAPASTAPASTAPASTAPASTAPATALQDTPPMSLAEAEARAQAEAEARYAAAPTTPPGAAQTTPSTAPEGPAAAPRTAATPPVSVAPIAEATVPAPPAPAATLSPLPPMVPEFTVLPPLVALNAAPAAPAPPAEPDLVPTVAGTPAPGGFTLYSGKPPRLSRPRPASVERAAQAAAQAAEQARSAPAVVAKGKPKPRPASVTAAAAAAAAATAPPAPPAQAPAATPAETPAASPDDGAALDAPALSPALAAIPARAHPKPRPAQVTKTAAAKAEAAKAAETAIATAEAATADANATAPTTSRRPMPRPRNFRTSVERALAAAIATETPPEPVAAAAPPPAPAPVKPAPIKPARAKPSPPPEPTVVSSPDVETGEVESTGARIRGTTVASVAKQATQRNALDLGQAALIGLYGAKNSRRALVRLPNGRFYKVSVGDRLDGGKVTAIGESQMTYQKGGRSVTLKLLKGG